MITLLALKALIYLAVTAAILAPVILIVAFILDYKSNSIW